MAKLNYYRYLKKYSTAFLRKVQTGMMYDLGRKSRWDALVEKMGHESQGDEAYIGPDHKAPLSLNKNINRLMWFCTIVYLIWYTFYVGDQVQAFLINRISSPNLPGKDDEQYFYYHDMYALVRTHPRQFV